MKLEMFVRKTHRDISNKVKMIGFNSLSKTNNNNDRFLLLGEQLTKFQLKLKELGSTEKETLVN